MTRECRIDDWNVLTQSRTTYHCSRLATMEVHDLSGKVIGKSCPFHAKQTEQMLLAVNGLIGAKFVSIN